MALRPIKILSICAGIGGLDTGLRRAIGDRARVVAHVEGEAYAAAVLVARMQDTPSFDETVIWSDVKTFDAKPWRGVVDIITAGYPCFTAGMHVLTSNGYCPISSLSVGDAVLTHQGRWRPITAIMRKTDVPIRTIRAQGTTDIVTTDEHPFYARRSGRLWDNNKRAYGRVWAEPRWQSAAEIETTDFLGQILPPVVSQPGSRDFWWLVGRYLADGWRFKRPQRMRKDGTPMANAGGRVIICCGNHESDLLAERIVRAGFNAWRDNNRTGTKFHITDSSFYEFLTPFGKYAHGKHLPGTALALSADLSRAMLDGYISGDGWLAPNGDRYVTTVSERLALGVCLLAQRAYGVVASIRCHASKRVCVIEGRVVNERPQYRVHIPTRNRSAFVEGNYGWKRVRKNEVCGKADVYNIAVEEDESYCVNGAIVHNCQPFSTAGKRRGTEDPRHLWPYIAAHIQTIRPAVVFCENVPGHLTLGFEQVVQDLSAMGYFVEAGIFSAAEIGAPHLRKRLFFIAYSSRTRLKTLLSNGIRVEQASKQRFTACARSENDVAHAKRSSKRIDPESVAPNGEKMPFEGSKQATAALRRCSNVAYAKHGNGGPKCTRGVSFGGQDNDLHANGQQSAGGAADGSDKMAYADSQRWHVRWAKSALHKRRVQFSGESRSGGAPQQRQFECGLGGTTAGISRRVDDNRWHAGWEDGVPRVTTGQLHRVDRLRALGNAVVPGVARLAFTTLVAQALRETEQHDA